MRWISLTMMCAALFVSGMCFSHGIDALHEDAKIAAIWNLGSAVLNLLVYLGHLHCDALEATALRRGE